MLGELNTRLRRYLAAVLAGGLVLLVSLPAVAFSGRMDTSGEPIFDDGFETGDLWSWSIVFPPDSAEPERGLFFAPTVLELAEIGEQGQVAITLRDFPHSLWGVQVVVEFDPSVVHATGIVPGQCPPPDFLVMDEVDNGAGVLRYAAVPLDAAPCAVTGGDLNILNVQLQRVGEGVVRLVIVAGTTLLSDGEVAVSTPMRDGWIIP